MHDAFDGASAHAIWESSPDAMLLVQHDGVICKANREAARLFGYPDGLEGVPVEELVPNDRAGDHARLRRGFHQRPARRVMGVGARLDARRRDGTTFPAHIALSPLGDDRVIAAVRDLSETVAVESRLIESARRRMLAEDHERIARDMHDTVIQELFAVGMGLQATVPGITEAAQAARVEQAVGALDDVIASIRALIFDIRTDDDDREDLRVRIVEIATSLIPSLGFEPSVSIGGPIEAIPSEFHDDILAVARESLTNVARHAEATAAAIEVATTDGRVTVRVVDNGIGRPGEPVRQSGHVNLADRARARQGSFAIRAHPDGGTTLEWTAPLTDPHPPDG